MGKVTLTRSATVVLLMSLGLCAPQAFGQEARKLLVKPTPSYPEVAKRLNLEGTVKIEVVVGPDGEITDTKVIGGHPILVEAALKALREWRYERSSSESRLQLEFKFHP